MIKSLKLNNMKTLNRIIIILAIAAIILNLIGCDIDYSNRSLAKELAKDTAFIKLTSYYLRHYIDYDSLHSVDVEFKDNIIVYGSDSGFVEYEDDSIYMYVDKDKSLIIKR